MAEFLLHFTCVLLNLSTKLIELESIYFFSEYEGVNLSSEGIVHIHGEE